MVIEFIIIHDMAMVLHLSQVMELGLEESGRIRDPSMDTNLFLKGRVIQE